MDFVNDNVYRIAGEFPQVVQRDAGFGGMYSLWFTDPIAFVSGDYGFQDEIGWSSFMHEMGHNYTLNTPADYHFGGRIDGNANAIYSETMAQIFQHATAYELLNRAAEYGLDAALAAEIQRSAVQSIKLVRSTYEDYVANGMLYASWNDPGTPEDETFATFMTLAFKFFERAEINGPDYRTPAKRMLRLLENFDVEWESRYDRQHNTADADSFRATLMVAALSYAHGEDLRDDFRALAFPISDEDYDFLLDSMAEIGDSLGRNGLRWRLSMGAPNPFVRETTLRLQLTRATTLSVVVLDVAGRRIATLIDDAPQEAGGLLVQWDGRDDHGRRVGTGSYWVRVAAGGLTAERRLVLID
jgi:hypothetical protein